MHIFIIMHIFHSKLIILYTSMDKNYTLWSFGYHLHIYVSGSIFCEVALYFNEYITQIYITVLLYITLETKQQKPEYHHSRKAHL